MELQSTTVETNEARLHVRTAGKGFPLILLHGWPQTSYCWRILMPLLAPYFRVIAPDLRGFGDSEKPEGPYDKRTIANDILSLAQMFGYDRFLLAGHDIGGRVAYRLTLDHPEVVAGLITLAGRYSPLGEDLLFSKEQSQERWYFFFHNIPNFPEQLVSGRERVYLEHFYRNWSYNDSWLQENDLAEYTRAYSVPGAMKGGFNHYRAALNIDPDQWKCDEERKIDTPTLVLWGRNDPISPLSWTRGFDRVFTDLDMKIYDDCGHFVAEEKAETSAQDILLFTKRLGLLS